MTSRWEDPKFATARFAQTRLASRWGVADGAGQVGGGAPAFDPVTTFFGASETGFLCQISDLATLFSDRSATPSTPASVDGVVGTIKDKSPNNNHAIAPSDAARGILRNSGSLYWIETDGIDDMYVLTTPVANCAAAMTTRRISEQTAWRAGCSTQNDTDGVTLYLRLSGTGRWGTYSGGDIPAGGTLAVGTDYVPMMEGGASGTFYLNGVSDGTYAGTVGSGAQLASESLGNAHANMRMYAAICRGVPFGADRAALTTWMGSQAGLVI